MRSTQLFSCLLTVSSIVSAWPWPPSLPNFKGDAGAEFAGDRRSPEYVNVERQPTSKPSPASGVVAPRETSSREVTVSKTDNSKEKHGSHTTSLHIPATAWVGGVNMLQPPLTSGSQYYRVDATVTWIWNYTHLLATPSKIDILATIAGTSLGGVAPSPFTLALNQSFEKTQTFLWDTGKYYTQTSPLPVGIYTLMIYDADQRGGSTAIPSPGYLAPWNQFYFGVYTPTPFALPHPEYQCVTCNAASGQSKRLTVGFLVAMVSISMGSFLWFAGLSGMI